MKTLWRKIKDRTFGAGRGSVSKTLLNSQIKVSGRKAKRERREGKNKITNSE